MELIYLQNKLILFLYFFTTRKFSFIELKLFSLCHLHIGSSILDVSQISQQI